MYTFTHVNIYLHTQMCVYIYIYIYIYIHTYKTYICYPYFRTPFRKPFYEHLTVRTYQHLYEHLDTIAGCEAPALERW